MKNYSIQKRKTDLENIEMIGPYPTKHSSLINGKNPARKSARMPLDQTFNTPLPTIPQSISNEFKALEAKEGIFISTRFREPIKSQALELKAHLERAEISTFVISVAPGGDIKKEVVGKLSTCRMAVILGSEDYGVKGQTTFGTPEELNFILENDIPFFLIKTCHDFQDATTKFSLPKKTAYFPWSEGASVPGDLVQEIVKKYHVSQHL